MAAEKTNIALAAKAEDTPSISIEGWDLKDADLAKLLEDTANYLKQNPANLADKDVVFRRVDTGELFMLGHRS